MADNLGGIAILLEIVDKASPELEKFSKSVDGAASSMKAKFSAFGAAVGAVGASVVASLGAVTAAAINYADEMGKAAQKSGISVEGFSALNYAAKLADVSVEDLTGSFQKLSKSIVDSQNPASKQAAAFDYLGVKTKDASGKLKDSETVFKEVSAAISKLPDGASKSAVAMDIFGKSGANLLPMLNAGADGLEAMRLEAERLGVVVSTQTAQAAEAFNDNMTRLKNGTMSFGLALAESLLPSLDVLAQSMIENAKKGEDFKAFAQGIGEVFKFVVKVGAGVIFTFNTIGKGLGAIGAAVAALLNGDFAGMKDIFVQYKEDVKSSATATGEFMQKLDDAKPIEKATDGVKALTKAHKDYKSTTGEDNNKKYDDLINQINREIDGVKNLTFAEQIRFEIAKGKYKDLSNLQKERVEALLKEADAMRLVNEATANLKKINEDISKAQTDTNVQAQARLTDATTYLNILQTKGTAAADAWRSVNDAIKPLEAQRTVLQELLDKATQIGDAQGVARYTAAISVLNVQIDDTKTQLQGVIDKTAEAANATQIWNTYIQAGRNELQQLDLAAKQLTAAFQAGQITSEEFVKALKKIDDSRFNLLKKELTDLEKAIASTAQAMQGDMSTYFFDVMQGKTSDLGKMFKRTLDKMVADMLASGVTNMLFGSMNTGTGQRGGGMASQALNWLFGGLGKRENGGPVTAGVPYIVGERRPEVFIPSQSGTIAPSIGAAMSGGGGTNVTFAITAMDSQDVMRSLEKIKRPLADLIAGTNRAYNK